jgi:hypothetical protein
MTQADSVHSTPRTDSPIETPAGSAGDLYFKTDVTPEQIFQAIGRLRKAAREEIDRLLQFLDATDDHMEREPDEDEEPECEDEGAQCEDEGSESDTEPSLASLDHNHTQEEWAAGGRRDLEEDLVESGIGDVDGLLEQVGTQDWQQGGMV